MAFKSEFKISLNLIINGNHKTIDPKYILHALNRGVLSNISVELVRIENLGVKVDQVARDQNIYKGIIKKALPNLMKNKTLKCRKKYVNDRFSFSIIEGDKYSNLWCGHITFEGNKVLCRRAAQITARQADAELDLQITACQADAELDLSNPNFVEQLQAFYGEKQ
jgi:hypothetical protein